ncbi:hypothetical protein AUC69_05390 [Methyloceanibacter superfactus]|uniref:Apolipoprotein N-acyltransferase n=1 Tax=Methyloceanibacter superfactus TaxID=1774969 RepID=A0A1E3W7B3_9HYPH|nr:apolipoprotein N-acyltransferase [Methyloceanibacter superfactus]ODS01693.1 hypothetical protein AUC69_05390 [Methyloceanibacter superfactus]
MSPLSQAAASVGRLQGAKRAGLAILLGALSVLAFAPVHAWPVLFVTFGGLVWLLDGCHAKSTPSARLNCAALTGFWFGFGYFLAGFYWVAEAFLVEPWRHGWLIPFVMAALPGGMALFFAAAAAIAIVMWRPGAARVFALAISLGLTEYARGHVLTGLPWNLIGYGLLPEGPMMQIAALLGVYALSLVAVALFTAPAAIWSASEPPSKGAPHLPSACLWRSRSAMYGATGAWRQPPIRKRGCDCASSKRISTRPANGVPRTAPRFSPTISSSPKRLGIGDIDIVVWPETAVPFLLADSPEALQLVGDALPKDGTLLVGGARLVQARDAAGRFVGQRIFNSLLVIDDGGEVLDSYDKIHLVPFGEYLPFQDFLESLGFMQLTGVRGGFSEGAGPRLLPIPRAPAASPLICYEIIFPDDVTDPQARPGWLLNLTNDAWFGTSAGPYQHFHQAQVRAVEQGLPLVRAANTGISAVVDSYGRVLAEIGLGERGLIDAGLPKVGPPTLFARGGIVLEISVLLLALAGWLAFRVRQTS